MKKTLFEKKTRLEKVYSSYKEILKDFKTKTNVYFINGEKSIKEVFEEIKKIIQKQL